MRIVKASFVMVLAAAWGCASNDPVNIGDDKTQRTKTGELLSDYAASWDGYAEAYEFPSGSDRVRLELDDEGNGTVVLGDGPTPAPATDPDAWYSPFGSSQGAPYALPTEPAEGFPYTVQHAEVHEKRIQFVVDPYEVFTSWCELQVPVRDTTGAPDAPEYGCLPYFVFQESDGERCWITDWQPGEVQVATETEVNCARATLCRGIGPVCTCSEDGCTLTPMPVTGPTAYGRIELDAALDNGGDALVGTTTITVGVNAAAGISPGDRVTVRLERQ